MYSAFDFFANLKRNLPICERRTRINSRVVASNNSSNERPRLLVSIVY